LFSGKAPHELSAKEVADIARLPQSPAPTAIIIVFLVLVLTVMAGIAISVAVPALARARTFGPSVLVIEGRVEAAKRVAVP
jgi:hypothetical protein